MAVLDPMTQMGIKTVESSTSHMAGASACMSKDAPIDGNQANSVTNPKPSSYQCPKSEAMISDTAKVISVLMVATRNAAARGAKATATALRRGMRIKRSGLTRHLRANQAAWATPRSAKRSR